MVNDGFKRTQHLIEQSVERKKEHAYDEALYLPREAGKRKKTLLAASTFFDLPLLMIIQRNG